MSPSTKLPRLTFAAPQETGASQFERWIERVSPLWSVSSSPETVQRFSWSGTTQHLGQAILSEVRCDAHSMRRDPALIARLGIDHIIVLVRRFRQCSLQPGREVLTIEPGDICFLDLSRGMWADVPDLDCITITMPRALLAPMVRDLDALHGMVVPAATPMGQLVLAHLEVLVRQAPDLNATEALMVMQATAALLAACTGRALLTPEHTRAKARPAVLLTVRRYVEQNLNDSALDAASLAKRFHLSRSTIYRLFQPLGGVEAFIRRSRLKASHAMLADPGNTKRIYEIAHLFHLGSDSSFSHAFKREFGLSPRDLQVLAAQGSIPSRPLPQDDNVYRWFADL